MQSQLSKANLTQNEDFRSLLENTGLDRMRSQVVFSPGETIMTLDRIIKLRTVDSLSENDKRVTRGRFTKIETHQYNERLMNAATRNGDESSFVREPVRNPETGFMSREAIFPTVIKHAADSASELYDAYSHKGLVWFKALTGINDGAIEMIEQILLPSRDGQIYVPDTLAELDDHLLKLGFTKFAGYDEEIRVILKSVLDDMVKAVRQATSYQTNIVDKAETELFNKRNGASKEGIQNFDDVQIAYFNTLGRIPQDKEIADLAKQSKAAFLNSLNTAQPVVTATGARCPYCAADVHVEAVKCGSCQMWIDPDAEVAYNEMKRNKRKPTTRNTRKSAR